MTKKAHKNNRTVSKQAGESACHQNIEKTEVIIRSFQNIKSRSKEGDSIVETHMRKSSQLL
jgi:hypothetical protein